ncbi:MAG: YigZ family protein [Bacteroidales bacterium]|nr:YigZ family protein [Bacteroidales bacterium]
MGNGEIQIQDVYRSISSHTEGFFRDNGSRFIAHAFPVESEYEIKSILDSLKEKYHDARHHCYAYRIGYKRDKYRANDDGEPSSSAGRPILGQIDSLCLSDILVVVVRYFGGVKLGIPGLIRAYRTSAADALGKATIIDKTAGEKFKVNFDYIRINAVMKVIKEMGLQISNLDIGEECSLETKVGLSIADNFTERIYRIKGCSVKESLKPES